MSFNQVIGLLVTVFMVTGCATPIKEFMANGEPTEEALARIQNADWSELHDRNDGRSTPLEYAVSSRPAYIVPLIDRGASWSGALIKSFGTKSSKPKPTSFSQLITYPQILKAVLQNCVPRKKHTVTGSYLDRLVLNGSLEMIESILPYKPSLTITCFNGDMPIIYKVIMERPEVLPLLAEYGWNPNYFPGGIKPYEKSILRGGYSSYTPLALAISENPKAIPYLLKAGAKVDIKTNGSANAIEASAYNKIAIKNFHDAGVNLKQYRHPIGGYKKDKTAYDYYLEHYKKSYIAERKKKERKQKLAYEEQERKKKDHAINLKKQLLSSPFRSGFKSTVNNTIGCHTFNKRKFKIAGSCMANSRYDYRQLAPECYKKWKPWSEKVESYVTHYCQNARDSASEFIASLHKASGIDKGIVKLALKSEAYDDFKRPKLDESIAKWLFPMLQVAWSSIAQAEQAEIDKNMDREWNDLYNSIRSNKTDETDPLEILRQSERELAAIANSAIQKMNADNKKQFEANQAYLNSLGTRFPKARKSSSGDTVQASYSGVNTPRFNLEKSAPNKVKSKNTPKASLKEAMEICWELHSGKWICHTTVARQLSLFESFKEASSKGCSDGKSYTGSIASVEHSNYKGKSKRAVYVRCERPLFSHESDVTKAYDISGRILGGLKKWTCTAPERTISGSNWRQRCQ